MVKITRLYKKRQLTILLKIIGTGLDYLATGTGKTLTALSAMTALSIQLNHVLGVIIVIFVCPSCNSMD